MQVQRNMVPKLLPLEQELEENREKCMYICNRPSVATDIDTKDRGGAGLQPVHRRLNPRLVAARVVVAELVAAHQLLLVDAAVGLAVAALEPAQAVRLADGL